MLQPGDVIEIFDSLTRPKKLKWHICICNRRRLFLRINSQPLWPPYHQITEERNAFLDHDSYVELRQLFHFSDGAVTDALRLSKNPLGRLEKPEARRLAMTARRVSTLNEEHKDLIWENLTSPAYR
jgi:hypothetical protein